MIEKIKSAPRGRPRSAEAHQAILQATVDLLGEVGYGGLTIEAIATRAGVGKKTIYRWWTSKALLALEALTVTTEREVPFPNSGSLRADLLTYFERSFHFMRGNQGLLLRGLVAEAQLDADFMREFQATFILPRRAELVTVLARAIERGELARTTDVDSLADMIYGAKWYRFLLRSAPLDDAFAESIVNMVLGWGEA